jgi:hypothetical protein
LRDLCPLPTGVANGPFKPILVDSTESIAFWGILIVPSAPRIGVTSTGSQSIGAPAASNIFITLADISLPIPSPGIKVTFRFCSQLSFSYERVLCKNKNSKTVLILLKRQQQLGLSKTFWPDGSRSSLIFSSVWFFFKLKIFINS